MVPSEKSLGEFPELLQVGELLITITAIKLCPPNSSICQENLTLTLSKQDHIYCNRSLQGMRMTKNKFMTGEII